MSLSDVHTQEFPYRPLSQNARNAVFGVLKEYDFTPGTMIKEEYPFLGIDKREFKANAIAFTHETHRTPDYTGFSVFNTTDERDERKLVTILARSAAPFHFIHKDKKKNFSFWFTNVNDRKAGKLESIKIESDVSYGNLSSALRQYSEDLNRSHIINVKQGIEEFTHSRFKEFGHFQLSLWAIDVTGESLVKHFGHAVNNLARYRDSKSGRPIPNKDVTDIAIQLLGAVILADNGTLGRDIQNNKPGIEELIAAARRKFPNYFNTQLLSQWEKAADLTYHNLTELCYSGFSPEMLTSLYREAYPDKEDRKALGRYDTPLYLTRRIWKTIPVEFLPPEKRVVADMTCGWGSFLIAGFERMSRMIDMREKSLRELITGNDMDNFTARLSGLGLLISTSEDSWDIESHDSEEWMAKKYGQTGPGIIVGNPPFAGDRKTIKGETHRHQKADKFMECAIKYLTPGGYMAMIMPQSFTISEASPNLRKMLLHNCDVQEIWELPDGLFPDATVRTAVLFARKKERSSQSVFPVRTRTLQKNTIGRFEESGTFTRSTYFSDQARWDENSSKSSDSVNTHIMDFKFILLESSWDRIESCCTKFENIAEIISGAIVGKNPKNKSWRDYPYPEEVNWLTGAKNVIKDSFNLVYDSEVTIVYPNDLEKPRKNKNPKRDKEHLLKGKKILLSSNTDPSWGKRVKVAIERRGYYVSDSFIVIAPKSEMEKRHITHEVVAAVMNWKISNAWIVEHLKHPKIPMRAVQSIPFPTLSKKDCEILNKAVLEIEESIVKNGKPSDDAYSKIDNVLKDAYRLSDEEYERVTSIYEWDTKPKITIDKLPDVDANWKTTGVVDSIDIDNGTITLWISDFDELQTVPISPSMPGWLLRPETAFRTNIPRESLRKRSLGNAYLEKFSPQDYTYLSEEEIFRKLEKVLS
ncbi:MAG: SAM-dependent methyltransferase [Proteobacteria bacterium]|nr:SAM-dependent methyltransferase [Pseudomonadota bacterium]